MCFRTPRGLEDVSKYPELFAELMRTGTWDDEDLKKVAGFNLLRVLGEVGVLYKSCSSSFFFFYSPDGPFLVGTGREKCGRVYFLVWRRTFGWCRRLTLFTRVNVNYYFFFFPCSGVCEVICSWIFLEKFGERER